MYYEISDRSSIISHVNNFIDIFENLEGNLCLNNLTNNVSDNEVQNLIYLLVGKDEKYSNPIARIILSECIRSESISSGSANIILRLLSYYFSSEKEKTGRKERLDQQKVIREEIVSSAQIISSLLRRASREDIKKLVFSLEISERLKEKIFEALQSYSIGEKFEVKKSNISESYISKTSGNFLPIEVASLFLRSGPWERESVSILLIDGTIENISQIHHLLEDAASSRDSFVIFCRSASEEVRETLGVNFIRGTVDLVLVETDFYPRFHHLFRDMAIVFDCDFVNIGMGDTLSSRIEKFKFKVDRVKIDSKGINFQHNHCRDAEIRKYISEIRDTSRKFADQDPDSYDDIKKSVDFRTKFLDSSTIFLNIGQEDLTERGSEMSKIDSFIRSIPDIGLMGVIDLSEEIDMPPIIEKAIVSGKSRKLYTQKQIFHSLVASFRIYETINRAEKLFTIKN